MRMSRVGKAMRAPRGRVGTLRFAHPTILQRRADSVKITDIKIVSFRTHADRWDMGHAKPLPRTELLQTVSSIETDEGIAGYFFGGGSHGDQEGLNATD